MTRKNFALQSFTALNANKMPACNYYNKGASLPAFCSGKFAYEMVMNEVAY